MAQFELVVVQPFAGYERGDRVTDQVKVEEILSSEHEHNVVRVAPAKAEG